MAAASAHTPDPPDNAAPEVLGFARMLAPRLAELKARLARAQARLSSGDPGARLEAIVESQQALREFLAGTGELRSLVGPVDALLQELSAETGGELPPAAPELGGEVQAQAPAANGPMLAALPLRNAAGSKPEKAKAETGIAAKETAAAAAGGAVDAADSWLRAGTRIASEMLLRAGMLPASADTHLEQVFATAGVKRANGAAIGAKTIKEWRTQGSGRAPRFSGVRPPLHEAKQRVAELASIFRRMARGE